MKSNVLQQSVIPDYPGRSIHSRFWITAAIGAAAAIGSALYGAYSSRKANKKNEAKSKALTEYEIELQRRENEYNWQKYNSPFAKMQAYQRAGLNPNLIYGSAQPVNVSTDVNARDYDYQDPGQHIAAGINNASSNFIQTLMNERALQNQERRTQIQDDLSTSKINLNTAQEALTNARTAFTKSSTVGQDLKNFINNSTKFDAIASVKLKNDSLRGSIQAQQDQHEWHLFDKSHNWLNKSIYLSEQLKAIKFNNDIAPAEKSLQLKLIEAQIKQCLANSFRSYQQGLLTQYDVALFGDTYEDRKAYWWNRTLMGEANFNRLHTFNTYYAPYLRERNYSMSIQNMIRDQKLLYDQLYYKFRDYYGWNRPSFFSGDKLFLPRLTFNRK